MSTFEDDGNWLFSLSKTCHIIGKFRSQAISSPLTLCFFAMIDFGTILQVMSGWLDQIFVQEFPQSLVRACFLAC